MAGLGHVLKWTRQNRVRCLALPTRPDGQDPVCAFRSVAPVATESPPVPGGRHRLRAPSTDPLDRLVAAGEANPYRGQRPPRRAHSSSTLGRKCPKSAPTNQDVTVTLRLRPGSRCRIRLTRSGPTNPVVSNRDSPCAVTSSRPICSATSLPPLTAGVPDGAAQRRSPSTADCAPHATLGTAPRWTPHQTGWSGQPRPERAAGSSTPRTTPRSFPARSHGRTAIHPSATWRSTRRSTPRARC